MGGELLISPAELGTQNSQGFKCRLEKPLERRSRNLEHAGKSMEIKIAGKSSVQIFLDSYSPPACPLSSVKILPGPSREAVGAGDLSHGLHQPLH